MDKSRLKEWKIDPLMEELQIRKCKVILYFELIFVYDVGQVFNLIFLHEDIQLFQYFFFLFCNFAFSRAAPVAFGGSQARGLIRPAAAGLCQGHSKALSEPRLRPTPQLTATPDP